MIFPTKSKHEKDEKKSFIYGFLDKIDSNLAYSVGRFFILHISQGFYYLLLLSCEKCVKLRNLK